MSANEPEAFRAYAMDGDTGRQPGGLPEGNTTLQAAPRSGADAFERRASRPAPPFRLDLDKLNETAGRLREGDRSLRPALKQLLAEAEAALTAGPFSVTHKTMTPPSGDKHDYMSFGRYWWPDPAKPDGLPYIRRDGETNPDSQGAASDRPRLGAMTDAVETLTLAYHFTGDERFAERAALLIRTWFIDPATRMTPHVKYAQGIPGVRDGSKSGLIDARLFGKVIDGVGLLAASPALAPTEREALRAWFRAYLQWLQTGPNPLQESAAGNNHGTWFDVQLAHVALFAGETDLVRSVMEQAVERRLTAQIQPDGTQPEELARTRPLFYSLFNLRAMFALARLAEHVGLDLWHAPAGASSRLKAALDLVAPYADPSKPSPYPSVQEADRLDLLPLLLQGSAAYGDDRYRDALEALPPDEAKGCRAWLLYPRSAGR
jgi:hypothetical protein